MNLSTPATPVADLVDLQPSRERIAADVVAGLSAVPRRLPSKYFYDARGSELFERITHQPEYYLTGVEIALMEARMADIARAVGPALHVVEYGSGSGRKTGILLAGLDDVVAYTPIEISRDALLHSVARLEGRF
ncbi:MAG: L-histidine N(alpha)-methyltransferase, partial [Gammaproteobacteria bacterium]|nr:L-histidine N(alpha)-methyltransferase [Gammaproteobacteria bacterium]